MFYMEIGCWAKWDQLLSEVDSSAELCEVRQVMQSGNCAPARQIKLCWWIPPQSHVGVHLDGETVN